MGGVETYLNTIIPELSRAGHDLAFWSEVDVPADRSRIELPLQAPAWCVAELGREAALAGLRAWRPDVIYSHKLSDPDIERAVLSVAPSVFFAHDYNGTCISGTKTFRFPIAQPCNRRFGLACLAHYFPHRCGGLSPITMFRLYNLQSKRQENLHRYDAIVTHSDHMLAELIKHGLSPRRAYSFPYYVQPAPFEETAATMTAAAMVTAAADSVVPPEVQPAQATDGNRKRGSESALQLLFSGRMEYLKGGHVFIDALPEVSAVLNRPIQVTFAGDGRERQALQRRAAMVSNDRLSIAFAGWVDRPSIEDLLKNCDLLVVPSLWPEPFGLVGPEAGHFGVPVAAFDVGGIHDWLLDGVNGYLASGSPPTAGGLARAIIKCLSDPVTHARLRAGAVQVSQQFNIRNHLAALLDVFSNVTNRQ